jgi:hypothetical protein
VKIDFWKEREVLDTNANICASSTNFLQIAWVDDFKQSTSPYFQKKNSHAYDPFGKDLW